MCLVDYILGLQMGRRHQVMRAHRLIRYGMVVALCAASPVTALAADWPAAKSAPVAKSEAKPEPKPEPKVVAKAVIRPEPAVAKVAAIKVEKPAPIVAAPVDPSSEIKALTDLVARQTAAIDAL